MSSSYDITLPLKLESNQSNGNWNIKNTSNQILSISRNDESESLIILSSNINVPTENTTGWLNVSSITANPNALLVLGNLNVSEQISTNVLNLVNSNGNVLSLISSNNQSGNLIIVLPSNVGSNGTYLRSLGNNETTWANASLSLFNASVNIETLITLGAPTNNFNIKLSPNINYFTPNSPNLSIVDPGPLLSDIVVVPTGRTFLRAWGILQLQFPLLGATQQRVIFNMNTTTGSGSRGAVATIPAASNNWRVTPAVEVQGVTSNLSTSVTWGVANIVPTLLSNSFISIQYY